MQALEADEPERANAIRRLLRTDAEAGDEIPPVVLLGTVAIGYRVIEREMRSLAAEYGFTHEALWTETDLLRRAVGDMRRMLVDKEGAA